MNGHLDWVIFDGSIFETSLKPCNSGRLSWNFWTGYLLGGIASFALHISKQNQIDLLVLSMGMKGFKHALSACTGSIKSNCCRWSNSGSTFHQVW